MKKVGMWLPIEKEPKSIRKGLMRIYSYKPTEKKHYHDHILARCYDFSPHYGRRVKDYYMDIPKVEEVE